MGVVKLRKQPGVTPTTYRTPDGYTVRRNGMTWSITAPDGVRRLQSVNNLDFARQRIATDRVERAREANASLHEGRLHSERWTARPGGEPGEQRHAASCSGGYFALLNTASILRRLVADANAVRARLTADDGTVIYDSAAGVDRAPRCTGCTPRPCREPNLHRSFFSPAEDEIWLYPEGGSHE